MPWAKLKPFSHRLLAYAGLTLATFAAFAGGFYIFSLAQFSHQALMIFEAANSPSASFLQEEIQAVDAARLKLSETRGAVDKASAAEEAAAKNAVAKAQALYEAKTAFKQAATPLLLRLPEEQVKRIQWGLDFSSLENNRALLIIACARPLAKVCEQGDLPKSINDLWRSLVSAQQAEQMARDSAAVETATANQKRATLITRIAELNATAATSPAKRSVMNQYQTLPRFCLAGHCFGADNNLQGVLVLLAVLMGAAGGVTLSWLRLIGSSTPTPIRDMFWPIPSGALAAVIGYFVILFGATLLAGNSSPSASPVDPRTVVALSLILGLGAQDSLEAFKSIGVAVREVVPRMMAKLGS